MTKTEVQVSIWTDLLQKYSDRPDSNVHKVAMTNLERLHKYELPIDNMDGEYDEEMEVELDEELGGYAHRIECDV